MAIPIQVHGTDPSTEAANSCHRVVPCSAWNDPVAGVSSFSAGICTVNLYGDGHRLLVADEDGTLKVRTNS